MNLFIREKNMIKNEFQKIYKKIISQAPIFDTFDDQIIKPKLVKCDNDYYFTRMRDFKEINLDEVVDKISDTSSNLLYYCLKPFPIYDVSNSQDFNLFKIKDYVMNIYDSINGYRGHVYHANIALQFSIIQFMDLDFKSADYTLDDFAFRRIAMSANDAEEDIEMQLNETLRYYDQYFEDELNEEYIHDITKGGIVFIYNIVDLANEKNLYVDYDIFENKKFLLEMIPPTKDYLKTKVNRYFKQANVLDKIKKVLTQKLIEIKNNY